MSVIAKFRRTGKFPETTPPVEATSELSAMDRAKKAPIITPARIGAALVAVLVLGIGAYGYARYGLQRSLSVSSNRLTISPVRQAAFRDYVPVTGNVAPKETVFLDAVEGGQVTDILVEDGAVVTAGQPLARLKNTRLELEVLGREAQLIEQQNFLANARLAFQQSELRNQRELMTAEREIARLSDDLTRQRPLANEGISIQVITNLEADLKHRQAEHERIEQSQTAERQIAQSNLSQLERSLARMTQSLTLVRDNLDNLNVTAPISGQLTGFELKVGEVIGSGQRIGQVDSTNDYKITALVDEFYLGRIAYGQKANADIGGSDYALTVAKVYPDVKERQFIIDLDFAGPSPPAIRRGQTLRPRIELGEAQQSLVVANGPFYDETGGAWVLVVSGDSATAVRRDVTLGRRNPEEIEILSGLTTQDRVITSSYQSFRDIDRIDLN